MSTYAKYDEIAIDYDCFRKGNGAQHYLGLVYSLTGKTAEQLNLLDAGCGTGNHLKVLLDKGLGKATAFDASTGMLEKAKPKLQTYIEAGRLVLEQHLLPKIPYDDSTFDVVMSNQVFQHLTTLDDAQEFTAVRKTLKEAFRVLKPNGALLVNMCTPYQNANSFWFGKVYRRPDVSDYNPKRISRVPEPEKFLSMVRDSGFQDEGMIVEPLDLVFTEEWYFNENGLLDPQWRNGDSSPASMSTEQLEAAIQRCKDLISRGEMKQFMLESDKMRRHLGQYAIYYARKA